MKKILLLLLLMNAFVLVKAQIVFNEFYMEPGGGESEFIELYNQGAVTEDLECYVAVFYYFNSSTDRGFIVLDMPSRLIGSKKIGVAASALPFNYQAGTYTPAAFDSAFSWTTDLGATSYVRQYKVNLAGTAYEAPIAPPDLNNLLQSISTGSTKYQFFLFKADGSGGKLVNALSINGPEALHSGARTAPDLAIDDPDGGGSCIGFNIKWTQTTASTGAHVGIPDNGIEYMGAAIGSGNGAKRIRDGQCGAWIKSSSSSNHTPGKLNGDPSSTTFQLTITATFSNCASSLSELFANFQITAGPASAFPVTVEVWEDLGTSDNLGTLKVNELFLPDDNLGGDVLLNTVNVISASTTVYNAYSSTVVIHPNAYDPSWNPPVDGPRTTRKIYLLFKTPAGCADAIREQNTCSTLPVNLKSFTAVRNQSNVSLKWVTANEDKNRGFDIQRFIGSGNWESVGFVSSKAVDGNSSSDLNYDFTDINNVKGVTQYRLKLVDMDGKSAFSMIRSIRGEGQSGKTIIYPNPTSNGKVNVVFDDGNVTRDVTLVDMNGRTIRQWRGTTNNNIQIENLNAGFYSVIILNKETGQQVVEKVLVQKR